MLRSTLKDFPLDGLLATSTSIPWGTLITPLAPSPPPPVSAPGSDLEPTRDATSSAAALTASDIPRCGECGAYISSLCRLHVRFWRCVLCHARNPLPPRYAPAVVEQTPPPADAAPELLSPVYSKPVDGGDAARLVAPTAYVFVVDATGDRPFWQGARAAIAETLPLLKGDALVGVVLYGEKVAFLDVRGEPVLRRFFPDDVEPAPATVFPPDKWLRSLADDVAVGRIDAFMQEMQPADASSSSPTRPLAPAIDRVLDAIDAGGLLAARISVIAAGPPTLGANASPPAGIPSTTHANGTSDRLPTPTSGEFADVGERAAALGALIDVYVACLGPADIATLAPVAQMSGGRITRYHAAGPPLTRDLAQHLCEPAVVRGLLRLRTSPEYAVADAYGCGVYRDVEVRDVYRLALHGEQSTMAVEFVHDDDKGFASLRGREPALQLAFRAVRVSPGVRPQRVLRVETRTYRVANDANDARANADANAAATVLFHRALAAADEHGIAEARALLFDWLAALLARAAGAGADTDQLATALDSVPALARISRIVFGLTRSGLLRVGGAPDDERAALRAKWEDLGAEWLASAAYPRLIGFHDLERKAEKTLPLSMKAVRESGCPVFLLDGFDTVVVYYAAEERMDVPFPPPVDCAVMQIQRACLAKRPTAPRAVVCREGEKGEHWFKNLLLDEPASGKVLSYAEFMGQVTDIASDVLDP